jgi:hypothetical protein
MTCGERTGHRVKSGELCRVSIGADSKGCFLSRTPEAVKRRWKLKGLKAMLAKKVPKEFIDGLEQQWTTVPGVQASLAR